MCIFQKMVNSSKWPPGSSIAKHPAHTPNLLRIPPHREITESLMGVTTADDDRINRIFHIYK